ncbi:hypothetical protein [Sphingobium yanoikuyae]|uniref:hypothetical protein n=1 Tax=Sphingobium yanoikuyae TaxID=13690 RepID=UPI0028A847A9|nr:hypothetical protein [Sphingobium yanoikuyae]
MHLETDMSRHMHLMPILGLLAWSQCASAKPEAVESWAKSGVSLQQFAADSRECADTSKETPVYIEAETLKVLDALSSAQLISVVQQLSGPETSALKVVEDISVTNSENDIARRSANFGGKFVAMTSSDVRGQLQKSLDQCLIDRGYIRIQLTEKQAKELKRFKRNTPERTAYLHSIDSDQAVVENQAVTNFRK